MSSEMGTSKAAEMTSKEKVLSVYPDAYTCCELMTTRVFITRGPGRDLSHRFATEAEAWDDAANQLPSAPRPAGETADSPENIRLAMGGFKHVFIDGSHSEPNWCRVCGEEKTSDIHAVPEPVSTEGLPSTFGQMTGNLKVPPIVEALGPLTERDLLGFAAEPAAPIAPAAEGAKVGSVAGWTLYRAVRDFLDSARAGTPFGLEVMDAAVSEWEAENPPRAKPSAEGDGDHKPQYGTSFQLTSGAWLDFPPTTDEASVRKIFEEGEYPVRRLLRYDPTVIAELPAPPSGQGEVK